MHSSASLLGQKGHLETVKVLHQHGANIDAISEDHRGISVLHNAVIEHHVDIIKYLINQGATMNVFDSAGFSPLHIAAKHGHTDITDLLIKGGSEVDCFFNDPMHTPLVTSITFRTIQFNENPPLRQVLR